MEMTQDQWVSLVTAIPEDKLYSHDPDGLGLYYRFESAGVDDEGIWYAEITQIENDESSVLIKTSRTCEGLVAKLKAL